LVEVRCVEHHARAFPERRPPGARFVAALGVLDLDNIRAERSQDLRTVGPRERARHVDDPHSFQRQESIGHTRATIRDRAVMVLAFLQNLIDLLTGSLWTYPLLFAICAGDAVFPAFPSETAMIVCGIQAARGQLSLGWVLVLGGAGAFGGDNASYALGRWVGDPVVHRFFRGKRTEEYLDWARRFLRQRGSYVLVVARFVPGGRTATTFTSGLVELRWPTRFAPYIFVAAILW